MIFRVNTYAVVANTEIEDPTILDVDEVLPEEIPAELLDRVTEHYAHLREIRLQVKRGSWKLLKRGKRVFQKVPPPMSVHDICLHMVQVAMQDAHEHGDECRYRAQLHCEQNGARYHRYAKVRGLIDTYGALQIIDDHEDSEDTSALAVMARSKEASDAMLLQSQGMLLKVGAGFERMGTAYTNMLTAAGELFAKAAGAQAEMLRVQMEMESNSQHHKERMAKFDRGFSILEGPASRIGDVIVDHVISKMENNAKGKGKGKGQQRPPKNGARAAPGATAHNRCDLAQTLHDVFGGLNEEQRKKCREVLTEDEWKLLEAARRSPTDAEFDGAFGRFRDVLGERGSDGVDDWIAQMVDAMGGEAMGKIGLLIKRIERARAKEREQQASP